MNALQNFLNGPAGNWVGPMIAGAIGSLAGYTFGTLTQSKPALLAIALGIAAIAVYTFCRRIQNELVILKNSGGKFTIQEQTQKLDLPGLVFDGPEVEMTALEVPLRPPPFETIHMMIHWVMHKHFVRESNPSKQRTFDPQASNVRVVDNDAAIPILTALPKSAAEFIQCHRFKELPSTLKIQFKRFIEQNRTPHGPTVMVKDMRPVVLPDDGIVDLSRYYDAPAGGPTQARYKIKRITVHTGDYANGQLDEYCESKGKYYQVSNDKGISENDFFGMKNAYSVILERHA